MSSTVFLSYRSFKRDGQELLCLDSKLHGELLQYLLGIAGDECASCGLSVWAGSALMTTKAGVVLPTDAYQ